MKTRRINGAFAGIMALALTVLLAGTAFSALKSTALADEVTSMSAQSAKINQDGIRARSSTDTSNNDNVVASGLTTGTEVTVTGQATAADGKVWYQVTMSDGKEAFIRSDFLELGEVIEEETPEQPEETEPEVVEEEEPEEEVQTNPIVSSQYVALYEEDDQGTYFWYLHNNDDGYRVKIEDLLDAARNADEVDALEKSNKTQKTAIIVMGVVIVVLVIIMIILIFRLRDYMYYEDDEEEEEQPEEEPRKGAFFKRRRDEDILEDEEPVRPQRGVSRQDAGRGRDGRDYAEERARSQRPVSSRVSDDRDAMPQRPRRESEQTRHARNVIKEDDDLEYEFLNIDDK
ncbi:MAG: GW dipeptide domain-containing protein [Lachnospiraceae bacterium]|nr:GW dipeptide domain-containing protein [Lachnospiraceae bacterium]